MKIETKFDIGESVLVWCDNNAYIGVVEDIDITMKGRMYEKCHDEDIHFTGIIPEQIWEVKQDNTYTIYCQSCNETIKKKEKHIARVEFTEEDFEIFKRKELPKRFEFIKED